MGFESFFECCERVTVAEVGWEVVPELGSRAAEGPAPHSAEAGRGHREVDGGRGSEGTGGDDDMQEVREVGRGEVVDGHECVQEEFVVDVVILVRFGSWK